MGQVGARVASLGPDSTDRNTPSRTMIQERLLMSNLQHTLFIVVGHMLKALYKGPRSRYGIFRTNFPH